LQRNKMIWSGWDIKTGKDNKNPLPEGHRIYDPEGIMQTVKPSPLKIKVKGILGGDTWEKRNDSARRVYDSEGISPTIPTGTGGGVMTKIVEEKKLCAIHSLYPRSGNPKQGGTGHLTKEPNDTYCLDTGNMQGLEFRNIKVRKEIDNGGRITEKTDGTTFTLGGGGRNNGRNQVVGFEDMKIRRLTPTECERLQGFPDGWTKWGYCGEKEEDCQMSDTQRYKQMGNAVTTNVIKAIGERLWNSLNLI